MREKTMDKMIACLTIAIIIMIVLFAVNIVLAVNDSKNTKTMANTESTADETGTSDDKNSEEADSDNQEESGTVVDNSEVQTSGNVNDTEATATETEKVTADVSQDYILPDSDSKYYTKSELSSLSKSDLRIARNEIYARNGYIFKDETLKSYFQGKSWYKGTTNDQKAVESKFNKYEKKNRDIIVELEEN
jgi:cytoskeletal protein RodZ